MTVWWRAYCGFCLVKALELGLFLAPLRGCHGRLTQKVAGMLQSGPGCRTGDGRACVPGFGRSR